MKSKPNAFPSRADLGTVHVSLLLLVVLGLVIVAVGIIRWIRANRLAQDGRHTEATAIRPEVQGDVAGTIGRTVVFAFLTEAGDSVIVPSVGARLRRTPLGSTVPVVHDPVDRARVQVDRPAARLVPSVVLVVAGLAMVALGAAGAAWWW